MRLLFLLLVSIASIGQIPIRGAINGTYTTTSTPAKYKLDRISVPDGSAYAFVFEPTNVKSPPAGGWPLIIFFGGDGTSNNNTRTFTAVAMSTSDNLTYTNSPTAALFRIMCSSIRIKVNGIERARGYPGGTIVGEGITGSITSFDTDNPGTNTSPTISVTFATSQAGNTITYDYIDSVMFGEGIPRWLNLGDNFDNRAIFIAVQNINNTNDLERAYWDNTVSWAWRNYTINPNRIHAAGISRGSRQIVDQFVDGANTSVLKTRYQFWIRRTDGAIVTADPSNSFTHATSGLASLVCGTTSYGGTFTAANYTNIGIAIVHGTGDGTLTNTSYDLAATLEANNEPPYILNISGGFHDRDVWDGKCYKRLYRNGISSGSLTTADWDYVDFLLKYSIDATECATLHVEQAEKRRYGTEKDIIDWRHANRKVEALSSGSAKTALQARLATLKTNIDNGGTRWYINIANTGGTESSPYNNITAVTTTYSSLIDANGNTTALDVRINTDPGGGFTDVGGSRRSWTGGFSKVANQGGLVLTSFPFATFQFTDVPSGTYTVRFYHNVGVSSFATNPTLYVDLNGSTTLGAYSAVNTLIGYTEYTGVPASALASFDLSKYNDNTYINIIELYKNP
jgi:hypothetical protein